MLANISGAKLRVGSAVNLSLAVTRLLTKVREKNIWLPSILLQSFLRQLWRQHICGSRVLKEYELR